MKEIKSLTSFKHMCMNIGNIPSSYMDSMSYYETLIWLIKFLKDEVIPTVNNNSEVVKELQVKFEELNSYVKNYFDNLDVQEEINNKLDEMAEEGSFESIIAQYVAGLGVNVKNFGAKGNDTNDDTESITSAISYCKQYNKTKLYFPEGAYKITSGFNIDFSNITIEGIGNAILKYYGNGYENNLINISGVNADDYLENITINNIQIDCTEQIYKGGYTIDTPKVTSPNPVYRGIRAIYTNYIKNLVISNCKLEDVYGDGIVVRYSNGVIIKDNYLHDVGSGNIVSGGQTGYDNHGDGIVCFYSYNCDVEGNTVINTRKYQENRGGITAINKLCGRSGLEFEYLPNNDASTSNPDDIVNNCPDYINIPLGSTSLTNDTRREGSALRFFNNTVQGYTKGIHIEAQEKTIITNNSLVGNYINLLYTTNGEQVCSNNYMNTYNVGKAPQGGYDIYSGNIAVTEYISSDIAYGLTISNNVISGDNNGITMGRGYVNIIGNKFTCKYPIYCLTSNVKNVNITSNSITNYDSTYDFNIFTYGSSYINITDNVIYSKYPKYIQIRGNYYNVSNNILFNTAIFGTTNPKNCVISGNKFNFDKDLTNNRNAVIYGDAWLNLTVKDNLIDLSSITNTRAMYSDGNCFYYNIDNNTVTLSSNQTLDNIFNFGTFRKSNISNNKIYNSNNINFFNCTQFNESMLINNICDNMNNSLLKCTASWGSCKVEKNIGTVTTAQINSSTTKLTGFYLQKGEIIVNYNITDSSTSYGWICTNGGMYITTVWSSGNKTVGSYVKNSNNDVYRCLTAGNSTIEPTSTDYSPFTGSDGVQWQYYGKVATIKQLNI